MTPEALAVLELEFTPGIGPIRARALLEHFGSAEAALAAPAAARREVPGLDAPSAARIGTAEPRERALVELERARKLKLSIVTIADAAYPEALRAIHDPPPVLWVRGDPAGLGRLSGPVPRAIGVVGTRRCSGHARLFAGRLSADLAEAGVVVVSGLARGIDTEAHRSAVDAGGLSVAVLGSGADRIYPAENAALSGRLLVLSAYPAGTEPAAHNFPARNRIIAGLSAGVVVVEGDLKSGALITAVAALEAGRTVFAVPGRPGEPNAAGPHRLLRDGAVLTEGAADVLEEMRWAAGPVRPAPKLQGTAASVYGALDGTPLLDEIVAATGLGAPEILTSLMVLSLQGHVRELPGGRYSRA